MNSFNNFETTIGGDGFSGPNAVDTPGGKEKGARRLQSVVPVCVRQIRDCGEEEFRMFGMKTQILTLVGILRDYDVTSTKATYQIEDHTGTISAIYWLDNDSNTSVHLPPVKEGRYLRVHGSLRTTDDVKTLLVLKMAPIENINEITTHLLEVVHVRLATENMARGSATLSKIARNNPGAELANSMSFLDDNTNYGSSAAAFNPLQQKVYNLFKNVVEDDTGVSRDEILSKFDSDRKTVNSINDTIEYLTSEGHVYSTIDNDHFKAT